ncbi:MAG: glycosyltransferase family 39 protein, partial [Anaerolineae bacterium]|nr:glycosyltransferase family 39 protein [Anaerolineae bacterium]
MKRALVAWVLLLLAAWCLWLWQLDASDLTFDEAATYFVAHRPVLEIVPYLRSAIREHPPLYYLLIRAWMVVAGTGEFSLRLFSVGMGMVALVLTGWAARTTRTELGAGRGVLPALFLAAMPGVAYYVRDARMYSMCIAWAALSCGLFLRDWVSGDGWPRRSAIVLLTGVHFLSLFTHYYLLLPMLIQPLLLLLLRRWRPLALWCAAHGLPAVAGLAWLLLAPGLQATTQGIWSDFFSLTLPTRFQFLRLLGKLVFSPVLQVPYKLLYQVLALAGAGLLLALWRRRVVGVWLALAAAIPLMLAYQLPQPPVERYVLFLTLPLALAWGALATAPLRLPWRWVGRVTVLLLALGTAYPLARGGLLDAVSYVRSRYGEVVETVAAYARPGDGVLFYGPWQHIQFIYYEPGDFPPVTMLPRYAPPRLDPGEAEQVLAALMAYHARLWVLPAAVDSVDPAHFAAGWLDAHAHAVWRGDGFTLYMPPLADDAPGRSPELTFGDALRLERVAHELEPLHAGDPLRVTLFWRPLRSLESGVELTLELVDPSGYVWRREVTRPASLAQEEPGTPVVDYAGLMVPPGAPPGTYTLRLSLVDLGSGAALLPGEGASGDLFTLTVAADAPAEGGYRLPNAGAATFCAPDGTACVELAGVESGGVRFQQGYPVLMALHWRADAPLPDLQIRLEMLHRAWLPGLEGTPIVSWTLPLAPTFPSSGWPAG